MANFDKAIVVVLKHEGGYINNPKDPGGETNFGICKRSYPNIDIRNLTFEQAAKIYKRDFWDRYKVGEINDDDIATKLFDLSINLGERETAHVAQRALRAIGQIINEDGIIGEITIAAINNSKADLLLTGLKCEAAGFYRMLVAEKPTDHIFLNNWLSRAYS